jgi:hypothetical protein
MSVTILKQNLSDRDTHIPVFHKTVTISTSRRTWMTVGSVIFCSSNALTMLLLRPVSLKLIPVSNELQIAGF